MIVVLSPAKSLDFESKPLTKKHTIPVYLEDSQELIDKLAKMSKPKVAQLMGISEKLSELNVQRYRDWRTPFTLENAKQALLAFQGDVYQGFDCEQWKAADFTFAQKHIRILSGLHGVLRPLDLIQPYRLEMGTKLKTARGKDLYAFWGSKITDAIHLAIKSSRSKVLVNLASNEYYRSLNPEHITAAIVEPVFKDEKNGQYKVISFFAKKARGLMANYIVRNRVTAPEALKDFEVDGYRFDSKSSDERTFTFLREQR